MSLCETSGDIAESDLASYCHHPVEDMEPVLPRKYDEESMAVRSAIQEASLRGLFIIERSVDFIMHADNKIVACWQTAFGLGLMCCEGISMTRAAEICGVSRACISKGARRFCELNDLPPSSYMKSEEAVQVARDVRNSQL